MSFINLSVLGSGSTGNSSYLESESEGILIDVGLSGKDIEQRLKSIGRSLNNVHSIFITHEHTDHVLGLSVIIKKTKARIFCNTLTRQMLPSFSNWNCFESGATIQLGSFKVTSFRIPHDAYDPMGFVFTHAIGQIGFLTDLGYTPKSVVEQIKNVRVLVLETNHDLKLLQNDKKRPWGLKQRILSRHGHLSNEEAAKLAGQLNAKTIEAIYLAHISTDCNTLNHARTAVEKAVQSVRIYDTFPDKPSPLQSWY